MFNNILANNKQNTNKYRADIDGLRAIAVIIVILFHLDFRFFSGGFVGVDIFFVISGFLITGLLKSEFESSGNLDFKNFYIRRIRRLLPASFSVFILTTCAAIILFSPANLKLFGSSLTSALLCVSNIFFWLDADYFDVSAKLKPLLHTWSLSVEWQFYLFWPFLFLILSKLKNKMSIPVFLILGSVISLYLNALFADGSVDFIKHYINIENGRATIFYLLPFRVFEFGIGASLVWLIQYQPRYKFINEIIILAGLLMIGFATFSFDDSIIYPYYNALLPCLGTAFIIYTGGNTYLSKLLKNSIFVNIGLFSYSLYLVHWPLIVFWSYIKINEELVTSDRVMIIIIAFILAIINYYCIEKPFHKQKIDNLKPFWKRSAVFSFIILIIAGFIVKLNDGWASRISPPVVFENTGSVADFHKEYYGGAGYPSYGPVCTKKPADIVLMGDSHGRHYAEGLNNVLAKPYGLNLYIASGSSCFHLPGFTRKTKGHNWDKICPDSLKKALHFIKSNNNTIVIISHAWASQIKRADLLDFNGRKINKAVDLKDVISGILSLKKLIGNRTLFVIGEVPRAHYNLYDIFSRPSVPFVKNLDTSLYLTSKIKNNTIVLNNHLKAAAVKTGKFIFLDPHNILCSNDICKNTDDFNRLTYSDRGHLSKYGSEQVIRGFLPELKKIMRLK